MHDTRNGPKNRFLTAVNDEVVGPVLEIARRAADAEDPWKVCVVLAINQPFCILER